MSDRSGDTDHRLGSLLMGRYRVDSLLGSGGMGTVYKGTQLTVKRPVAIKFISGPVSNAPESARRFEREAEALAQLQHPNSVRIFELGHNEKGELFTVMEWLEGQDLGQYLGQRGALPVVEALNIVRDVLAALSEAHAQRIVHRDIKPANIFLARMHDGGVIAKVMDFGIAAFEQSVMATKLTLNGAVMGTPAYMSPEQACGEPLDGRSDLYSLGITLFQMLTGQVPFEADSLMSLLHAHRTQAPPRLEQVRPDLRFSAGLQPLLDGLLDKVPARRPATAREVTLSVEAILRDEHRPPATPGRPWLPPTTSSASPVKPVSAQTARPVETANLSRFGALPLTLQSTVLIASRDKRMWTSLGALVLGLCVWVFWPAPEAPPPKPSRTDVHGAIDGPPADSPRTSPEKSPSIVVPRTGASEVDAKAPRDPELRAVRISSLPSGASVQLKGVEVGKTPFELQYRADSDLTLVLPNHAPYPLHISSASEPLIAVRLTKLAQRTEPPAAKPAAPPTTPPPTTPPPQSPAVPPRVVQSTPPAAPPAAPPAVVAYRAMPRRERKELMATQGPPYSSVRAAKQAYSTQVIDEDLYDDMVWALKARRKQRIALEKINYKNNIITRDEYSRRVDQIDLDYEGGAQR